MLRNTQVNTNVITDETVLRKHEHSGTNSVVLFVYKYLRTESPVVIASTKKYL
jgi:hypothetical protein